MKKRFVTFMLVFLLGLSMYGEEGMWLLTQLQNLDLQKKGLEIETAKIYTPGKPCLAQAVVGMGATAEVVSPDGLLLTNHHVAFGAVQRASTKGTDYITNGFLAKTKAEEIEAPGYSAYILEKMEDVTATFKKYQKIKDLVKRKKAIDKKIKAITEKIEKGGSDVVANIDKMYDGLQYVLSVYTRYDDVRVVYVPPASIGNYGGDIDNWMWPRHTGDFSYMRIYMSPDGKGRKYHKDNIPFKAKSWIKIAEKGLSDGDFTFIMGYPGRTTRYLTSNAVDESLNYYYPYLIDLYGKTIKLLESFEGDSQVAKAKVAGFIKGLNNAMKNYQGNVDGMKRTNFLQSKIDYENELTAFLKKDKNLFKKYGSTLDKIKKQFELRNQTRDYNLMLRFLGRFAGTPLGVANAAYVTAKELEKPKRDRNPNYSEKQIKRRVQRLRFTYMSFYEPADKAMLSQYLNLAKNLPEGQRIKGLESVVAGDIDAFIKEAYAKTKLKDPKFAMSLYTMKSKELAAIDDPFIKLAVKLYDEQEARRKLNEKRNATLSELRKNYIQALYAWKGKNLYPDADGTFRLSYGNVAGYNPRDAVSYKPFTTLKGVVEKYTGKEPFDMPKGLKELYKAKDYGKWAHPELNDIPIAFTHKVDSTGGNSGSPVFNAKGELAGILFDGNYEAMTGDWQYDPEIQRTISVDIRYVMFITEKLAKAYHLLEEMGVKPSK